jgi:hypothetical protein
MRERGSNPPDGIRCFVKVFFFFCAGFFSPLVQTQHRGTAIHFILFLPPVSDENHDLYLAEHSRGSVRSPVAVTSVNVRFQYIFCSSQSGPEFPKFISPSDLVSRK